MVGCSEIHTKHINTLCVQNVKFLNDESGGAQSKAVKTCWKQNTIELNLSAAIPHLMYTLAFRTSSRLYLNDRATAMSHANYKAGLASGLLEPTAQEEEEGKLLCCINNANKSAILLTTYKSSNFHVTGSKKADALAKKDTLVTKTTIRNTFKTRCARGRATRKS